MPNICYFGQPMALDEAWNQLLEERAKRIDQIFGSKKE